MAHERAWSLAGNILSPSLRIRVLKPRPVAVLGVEVLAKCGLEIRAVDVKTVDVKT